MEKVEINDRVIFKGKYTTYKCIVLKVSLAINRVYIEKFNTFTVSGANVKTWVSIKDLERDIEYYRNEKLEKIGI